VFELPMSQMLIPLNGPPAPPVILRLFSHDQDGPASALSLAAMVAAGAGAAILWMLARRWARRWDSRGANLAPNLSSPALSGDVS